jgi:hypothetical protein
MTTFESSYKELALYGAKLSSKHKSSLTADDLINEAFLKTLDQPFDIDRFRVVMFDVLETERRNTWRTQKLGALNYSGDRKTVEDCTCIRCKETKNINGFVYNSTNAIYVNVCHECNRAYMTAYYQANKDNEALKEQRRKASRKYHDKSEVKAAQIERAKKWAKENKEKANKANANYRKNSEKYKEYNRNRQRTARQRKREEQLSKAA